MVKIVLKVLKWIGVAVLVLALFLFIVIKFGSWDERYECKGTFTFADGSTKMPQTVFIRVTHYRWFIFWADGDGSMWSEVPNQSVNYYPRLRVWEDELTFSEPDGKRMGTLSKLSNAIRLESPGGGSFEGTATKIIR